MPKGKKSKDPGAKAKRKNQRRHEEIAQMLQKRAPVPHQFKPNSIYVTPDSSGGQRYYRADKGGSLRRVEDPNQGRAR